MQLKGMLPITKTPDASNDLSTEKPNTDVQDRVNKNSRKVE